MPPNQNLIFWSLLSVSLFRQTPTMHLSSIVPSELSDALVNPESDWNQQACQFPVGLPVL